MRQHLTVDSVRMHYNSPSQSVRTWGRTGFFVSCDCRLDSSMYAVVKAINVQTRFVTLSNTTVYVPHDDISWRKSVFLSKFLSTSITLFCGVREFAKCVWMRRHPRIPLMVIGHRWLLHGLPHRLLVHRCLLHRLLLYQLLLHRLSLHRLLLHQCCCIGCCCISVAASVDAASFVAASVVAASGVGCIGGAMLAIDCMEPIFAERL